MSERKESCKTCYFCEKHEVPYVPRFSVYTYMIKDFLPDTEIIHKCHIQGPPQKVNIKNDWCHQWRKK
jgi:hypothetical protein